MLDLSEQADRERNPQMLENLKDLRTGLKHIMTLERSGKDAEAAEYYETVFRPSLALVGEKIGQTPDQVRALLQARPSRARTDFS